jgi:hypothetical protein
MIYNGVENISFLNCCDHNITLVTNTGREIVFPPCNYHARKVNNYHTTYMANDIPIVLFDPYPEVVGIPPARNGILYIVSHLVFAETGRLDVVKPDGKYEVEVNGKIEYRIRRFIGKSCF